MGMFSEGMLNGTRLCRLMDHGTCETSVNDSICRINQHDIVSEEANKLTQTTLQNLDQIHDWWQHWWCSSLGSRPIKKIDLKIYLVTLRLGKAFKRWLGLVLLQIVHRILDHTKKIIFTLPSLKSKFSPWHPLLQCIRQPNILLLLRLRFWV